jgi:cyanophycinase
LRRAALDRQGPPFPAKKVRSPVVPEGTLFLVGGGRVPGEILDRFFAAAGGERARLAIIPISSPAPLRRPLWLEEEAERRGVEAVNVLQPRTPEGVDDPEVLRFLDTATAVWFGGGRQWRFVDAYEDTRALERLHAVLKRGGVIGGSSAGASIQAEYMARGNPLGSRQIMAEGYERGLDFLPGAAVDQHFRQRNRFPDMEALMRTHSQLLGIGIDEATALVVREHHAEVLGEGEAHFYDWRQAEGAPEALGRGEVYDLVKRSVAVRPQ